MLRSAYKALLMGPNFRGRNRIEGAFRYAFKPSIDEIPGGLKMHLDTLEWTQITLLANKETEPMTIKLVRSLLSTGSTCVDIGCHVGWVSLNAAKSVGPSGTVIAVDPQPYNCERVMQNAALNGFNNILTVQSAISDRNGFVRLAQQAATDKARLSLEHTGVNDVTQEYLTACMTLDHLAEETEIGQRVALLKVDVEGHEFAVFSGAERFLPKVDNIIFEDLPGEQITQRRRVYELLQGAGFKLCTVDGQSLNLDDRAPEDNIWATRLEV